MRIDLPAESGGDPYTHAVEKLAPEIMQAGAAFSHAVYKHSKLSLREFEGARLRIADINGCLICQQFRAARDLGGLYSGTDVRETVAGNGPVPDDAFYANVHNWRTSDLYSEREKLAMEFAERFAEEPKVLAKDEDFWARFRAKFSDAETVDLANCAASWMLGRVAHVLGFDQVCLPAARAAE